MTFDELSHHISQTQSYLCVGLDSDPEKIPPHLHTSANPVLDFNRRIIEATAEHCVAYKLNTAFYEAQGAAGWTTMQKTLELIPKDKFVIADAKRGDIGNTVHQYAKAFFEHLTFDAITVAPYMGEDSVLPFLQYKDKWVILLALTSNTSASTFQMLQMNPEENGFLHEDQNLLHNGNQEYLFERVIKSSQDWGSKSHIMYVVGATKADKFKKIRQLAPEHFLLVPGVGSQGGDLEELSRFGLNQYGGLLVNVSRGIIFASEGEDFAEAAQIKAQEIHEAMKIYLKKYTQSV
ncbi:MAG: orotidine-5'-phosphate decarboxylase [Microscillaceae bacterium]|nr:orotidine-5'-phosphate decarboxylase [Microscillaceae bacterium]